MTKIEWTNEVWNPVIGCSPVSEGCRNCYAARHALRLAKNPRMGWKELCAEGRGVRPGKYEGLATKTGDGRPVFTGVVRCLADRLDQPLRWKKPRHVFVNSMSDLFHPAVSEWFIGDVWRTMALAHQHTFQVLTKRPGRAAAHLSKWNGARCGVRLPFDPGPNPNGVPTPLPNVWLGVSVEDQATADERIPLLLQTPAALRFVSYEPALGPVNLERWLPVRVRAHGPQGWEDMRPHGWRPAELDWVIVGGESGPRARPCNVEWIRSIVRQCRDAEVPVFVKQLGARPVGWCVGRLWGTDDESEYEPDHCDIYEASEGPYCKDRCQYLRHPKGGDPSEWPEGLRVREWPERPEVDDA